MCVCVCVGGGGGRSDCLCLPLQSRKKRKTRNTKTRDKHTQCTHIQKHMHTHTETHTHTLTHTHTSVVVVVVAVVGVPAVVAAAATRHRGRAPVGVLQHNRVTQSEDRWPKFRHPKGGRVVCVCVCGGRVEGVQCGRCEAQDKYLSLEQYTRRISTLGGSGVPSIAGTTAAAELWLRRSVECAYSAPTEMRCKDTTGMYRMA